MRERRWRRAMVLAVLGAAFGTVPTSASAPAGAQDPTDGPPECVTTEVPPLDDEVLPRACKSRESGRWLLANGCRRVPPLQEPVCPAIDDRPVHESAMQDHERSWLHRALALQSRLDLDVPLGEALLPHTHNSANSAAYAPSVSSLDANQVLTLTDQLRLGMRAIEIDVHWVPHPSGDPAAGGRAVVQCHGEPVATPAGVLHAGCSVDTLLIDLLDEVATWLHAPGNRDEVLLLYLENALDGDPAAHEAAVAAIASTLGDELVARPAASGGCQPLPVHRTKAELLHDGTRVLITGNCGPGAWTDWVFERGSGWDESGGSTFACPEDRLSLEGFGPKLVRRYEDSTWLSAMAGSGSHRDEETMDAMVECGVNLVGFDQAQPGDARLASLVWSWRSDEPAVDASGLCAAQGTDGRFFAADCSTARPVACRAASGSWAITPVAVAWASGDEACRAAGHAGAGVPYNGWDNRELRAAAGGAAGLEVWLAYRQDGTDAWVAGDAAVVPEPPPSPLADPGDRSADPEVDGSLPSGHPGSDGPRGEMPVATTRALSGSAAVLTAALAAAVLGRAGRRRRHT